MNGAPRYKEGFFLRYKKEIALTVGTLLTMATVVKFIPQDVAATNQPLQVTKQVEEAVSNNVKRVVLDGIDIGFISNVHIVESAIAIASDLVVDEIGYDPEVAAQLELVDDFSLTMDVLSEDELALKIKDSMIASLDVIKVKAYVMKIGDNFTVTLQSEEEIKEVLKRAQRTYISEETAIDITLGIDERNSLVLTPKVVMMKEEEVARTFKTESLTIDDFAENPYSYMEQGLSIAQEVETPVVEEVVETVEEAAPVVKNPEVDGVTVEIGFAAEVVVIEAFVDPAELLDVNTATELVTKENEKATTYAIQQGDVLGAIAQKHNMKLEDLYKLNPGLEARESKIQIGEEVVVMVPESELKVATKEEVVYTKPIARGTSYVDDANTFKGTDKVIDNGSDGLLELTAIVSKVNGDEVTREIIKETVLEEPKDKVISRGTKPLPSKAATGNLVYPMKSYRISSPYGSRSGGFHTGIDLAASWGANVYAADGGTVVFAGWRSSYGYTVDIDHGNGVMTRYAHNSSLNVKAGQKVAQYESIAKVGSTGRSTGPHVHFEVRINGKAMNPSRYLNK